MRHGTSGRRQRNNRNNNNHNNNGGGSRRNGNQRTQVYDSNGPDVRIRGTAHQVAEKYLALAKDASAAGDWIVAENYFQHAEHYVRIINEASGSIDAKKITGEARKENMSDDAGNKSKAADDDLALPASIIGGAAEKTAARVEEDVSG